jgi:GntP family gluconate:H+ symporter
MPTVANLLASGGDCWHSHGSASSHSFEIVKLIASMDLELHPLLILAIGIGTIIGLIVVLRTNAFLALIAAAMLVSLLAPGEAFEKFTRVGTEFGQAAGNIGIVIGLAAIIGQCMMDSGAADRIVRSFLRLFGEKRASWALAGSGYVLGIPVFFDTVFYLLVPLARSLFKQTGRNFLLYVLAISAGGAITHTLVPPTPGPLVVAGLLGVDLGVMILVGMMVAAPVAVVGLLVSGVFNRMMPIPARDLPGMKEYEPLPDAELPSLWISVLPVALPVLLIGASTMFTSLARREYLDSPAAQEALDAAQALGAANNTEAPQRLADLKDEATWLPDPQTPMQRTAQSFKLFGHPIFALFLSAVIAMAQLVVQRRLNLTQLGSTVELALMSGGLIILITSAGGAFGAMLRTAGIGEAIRQQFMAKGEATGVVLLLVAFGISSVLKIAQGSSTVAMITAAGIVMAMLEGGTELPFDMVYLALAIGGGSLVCSWMNDSGFWIVAKMSGFTELESLKAWTVMLAIMGTTALGVVLVLSQVIPFPMGSG